MRKFAWLTLFAAAALLFSAPDRAFAHQSHQHSAHAQHAAHVQASNFVAGEDHVHEFEQITTAADWPVDKCPHAQHAGCETCCACGGHASAAIPVVDALVRSVPKLEQGSLPASNAVARQTTFDLTRPPKSFA